MIDRLMTGIQGNLINKANSYVYRNTGPYSDSEELGRLENRIVMVLALGTTSLVDYVKLPWAVIEKLVLGTILIPTIPFSGTLRKHCLKHYRYALLYMRLIPLKLTHGIINDVKILKIGFESPQKIPAFLPPSYYGSAILYKTGDHQPEEIAHPSIYFKSF